ncbi:hypothetical protein BDY17DRAFT_321783 [Neohortaea acidophila]|uniref:Uncharacterized protein n=1 Tax=Neohortaea acidophila TaxID=245834 RepID=A0A6A6PYR7_9PEZI|nr:uncharacterized protein BDY17DRAFT_321783 [Neohortaea acidophila]KAF2484889.1 hypothetical protein BDY17DRAFT_321783 [Neohortaea acidophila]
MASVALGGVANFCAQEPFRQMQDFRGFDLAMERCALHYAAQTTVKTLPNECLTTTKTVILSTNTVHVTSRLACPTNEPHVEIRDSVALERRAAEPAARTQKHTSTHGHTHTQAAQKKTGTKKANNTKTKSGQHTAQTKSGHHTTQTKSGHHTTETKSDHHTTQTKSGHHTTDTKSGHHTTETKSGHHTTQTHTGTHTGTTTHTHGPSKAPRDLMDDQRRAGPTPVAFFKRDAAATKTAEWSSYYGALAECGYNCIQTACSCVGTLQVVLQTPAPTCTSTLTKETVVHETKTVQLAADSC